MKKTDTKIIEKSEGIKDIYELRSYSKSPGKQAMGKRSVISISPKAINRESNTLKAAINNFSKTSGNNYLFVKQGNRVDIKKTFS